MEQLSVPQPENPMQTLTPLPDWCKQVGLDYQRGWRLAKRNEIDVTKLGTRYYVLGDGLGDASPDDQHRRDENAEALDENSG
jgi:hypothetical protein